MATVKLDPAKGIQIPNLTTTERNAISSPETGAIIWNTTTSEINQYNGSAWGTVGISEDTTKLPLAGGTLTGDLNFGDNVDANFGAGADLKIYHDGSNSYIDDVGTGNLNIKAQNLKLLGSNGDNLVFGQQGGAVTLYHSNAAKFATTSTGVAVTGGVAIGGTAAANTLDDYEEGTWTPTVLGTTSCSMSTIHQSNYTKIGNVVKLYTSFNVASSASPATGTMRFGGFPFSFKTSGETAFLISLHYNYKDTPMAFVNQNGNIYYQNGTTGGNNLGDLTGGFDSVTVVGMNFTYLTS